MTGHRRIPHTLLALATAVALTASPAAVAAPVVTGEGALLTDPFLQLPQVGSVNVAWFTEDAGTAHAILTGDITDMTAQQAATAVHNGATGVNVFTADTAKLSRMTEDHESVITDAPAESDGIVARDVYRHEGTITGIPATEAVDYRVVSIDELGRPALSRVFQAQDAFEADESVSMLLTSDHQQKNNAPANLQYAADTIAETQGPIDVALIAGDLINVPDRASEWFDHDGGLAFFQGMQGTAEFVSPGNGVTYHGGQIAQNAVMYPVIGNHEVQGRIDGQTNLTHSFNHPVPREVAEAEYEKVAAAVNPTGDAQVREQWIEDNSFSTTSYEEIFTLPESESGGEAYYSTSIGNTRLISLYSTRIWRNTKAIEDPAARTAISRYHESQEVLDQPLERGYGDFIFEDLAVGSEQYSWLEQELVSPETLGAENVIVMLHESPHSLGNNAMPHFSDPVETVEKDAEGNVIGITYEYPAEGNILMNSLMPLIDRPDTPVNLVFNGHSHLWNRFQSDNGVNFIETSNVGNSYGARHELSGDGPREVPSKDSAYWDPDNYLEYGAPGGLEPIVPTVEQWASANDPDTDAAWLASNEKSVFSAFDSETGIVRSWMFDGTAAEPKAVLFDEFSVHGDATVRPGADAGDDTPTRGSSVGPLAGALAAVIAILATIGAAAAGVLDGLPGVSGPADVEARIRTELMKLLP